MRHMNLSVLAFLALLFVGCDKKAEPKAPESDAQAGSAEAPTETAKTLTIYCGRNEEMVKPLIEKFGKEAGVEVKVQYAKSAQLAATLMEEGDKSPADVFFAQDASTLGFLEKEGKLERLPQDLVESVPEAFRSNSGAWVGTSGRARVLAYNTEKVKVEELPADVDALVNERWKGKLGWAPENASFQSFVAAMIAERGEEATKAWLASVKALEPKAYPSNTPMVTAIGRGEIEVGLTNHYYLYRLKAEHGEEFAAANHYFRSGKAGSLVNAAGVGVLKTTSNKEAAEAFVRFLLTNDSQRYFATETHEFPLVEGVDTGDKLPGIMELKVPPTDLGALGAIEPAVKLLKDVGALQ